MPLPSSFYRPFDLDNLGDFLRYLISDKPWSKKRALALAKTRDKEEKAGEKFFWECYNAEDDKKVREEMYKKYIAHIDRHMPPDAIAKMLGIGISGAKGGKKESIPAASIPVVSTPAFSTPAFSTPTVSTPTVSTPVLSTPIASTPVASISAFPTLPAPALATSKAPIAPTVHADRARNNREGSTHAYSRSAIDAAEIKSHEKGPTPTVSTLLGTATIARNNEEKPFFAATTATGAAGVKLSAKSESTPVASTSVSVGAVRIRNNKEVTTTAIELASNLQAEKMTVVANTVKTFDLPREKLTDTTNLATAKLVSNTQVGKQTTGINIVKPLFTAKRKTNATIPFASTIVSDFQDGKETARATAVDGPKTNREKSPPICPEELDNIIESARLASAKKSAKAYLATTIARNKLNTTESQSARETIKPETSSSKSIGPPLETKAPPATSPVAKRTAISDVNTQPDQDGIKTTKSGYRFKSVASLFNAPEDQDQTALKTSLPNKPSVIAVTKQVAFAQYAKSGGFKATAIKDIGAELRQSIFAQGPGFRGVKRTVADIESGAKKSVFPPAAELRGIKRFKEDIESEKHTAVPRESGYRGVKRSVEEIEHDCGNGRDKRHAHDSHQGKKASQGHHKLPKGNNNNSNIQNNNHNRNHNHNNNQNNNHNRNNNKNNNGGGYRGGPSAERYGRNEWDNKNNGNNRGNVSVSSYLSGPSIRYLFKFLPYLTYSPMAFIFFISCIFISFCLGSLCCGISFFTAGNQLNRGAFSFSYYFFLYLFTLTFYTISFCELPVQVMRYSIHALIMRAYPASASLLW